MRLGRVAIGGLQADEQVMDAMVFQRQFQPAIRFSGGHRQQPALPIERIEEAADARIERLGIERLVGPQALESGLVVFGEAQVQVMIRLR